MSPVAKAVWYIEAHMPRAMTLDEVATFAGVTPYHLAHVFMRVTGQSILGYARRRRLSLAARKLADGGGTILEIALDHGYASHEAFTRAFRAAFDVTPDQVRSTRRLPANLEEPLAMSTPSNPLTLTAPRLETYGPFSIAGIALRTTPMSAEIPKLWQTFGAHMGHVPGQRADSGAVGLCDQFDPEDNSFRYVAAVELAGATSVEPPLLRIDLPKTRYAVFFHAGHVSRIGSVWSAAMTYPLPQGLQIADAASFEYYDHRFDPATGNGGFELWLPVTEAC